jgi:hypothetical protein
MLLTSFQAVPKKDSAGLFFSPDGTLLAVQDHDQQRIGI